MPSRILLFFVLLFPLIAHSDDGVPAPCGLAFSNPVLSLSQPKEPEFQPATGGPPMFTNDTGTPDKGHFELNFLSGAELSRDERRVEAPHFDFNYGPTKDLQLSLEVPYVFRMVEGESTQSAWGDMIVGVKYRFFENEQSGLSLGVYPQLEFNVGDAAVDRGIEDRGVGGFLPIIATQTLGRFSIGGEAGPIFRSRGTTGMEYGVVGGYKPSKRVGLLAEIYGQSLRDLYDHEVFLNLVSRIALDKNKKRKLLLSVGRTLAGAEKYVAQIGIQYLR